VVVADTAAVVVAADATATKSSGSIKPKRAASWEKFRGAACQPQSRRDKKGQVNLPKEDAIEVMGKVVEKFKAGMFSIEIDVGRTVLATMAGKLRRNRIKIMNGDKVSLELSPYDLTRGRITYRHK